MNDPMEPLVQFSPFSGQLKELTVPGETSREVEHENDVYAADGAERTMLCYAPRSGCPDAKQTQVLFVLRQDASRQSAQELMERLKLDELAEKEHFLLLFPNPTQQGWNYLEQEDRDNDMDFLIRCFGLLRGSELKVNGFNGMLFYLAACPEGSAMLTTMAAKRPASISAMMTGSLPEDYEIPENALGIEVAAWCCPGCVEAYLSKANGCPERDYADGETRPSRNPQCRLIVSTKSLDADTVLQVWDQLFSRTRRWQNDTYGSYQRRTAFTERGFTAHINESCMGVNGNYPHTWFTYIPPQLRGTTGKVPLVFYFHGVNCVPLYGAEQSNWHDIADRENFIVIYPAPAKSKCWNIYDLPNMPSDFAFVLALIDHIKQVHPIDESRIYATGFSMGGMMTHAITAAYPEIFAAGAPCNAFAFNRYKTPEDALKFFLMILSILLFAVGLVLLIKGGDWFVDGATGLARRFHLPDIIVGATVVSIGTTLPEVMVSATGAMLGQSAMAYGNAIGSIICNTALIAAISVACNPGPVNVKTMKMPVVFFFGSAVIYCIAAYLLGAFPRWMGFIMLAIFVLYMVLNVRQGLAHPDEAELEDTEETTKPRTLLMELVLLIGGAAVIAVGADLLVEHGTIIAKGLGVPETVIALTFVALGTSLPELVTTITSLKKGHASLGIGNVIGANVFNLVLVSGVAVTLAPFQVPVGKTFLGYKIAACKL